MPSIPSKVSERLTAGIKRFQPILSSAQARDVNESDTVIIITDMLSDVFGYDKYSEVTSENSIRGTYCDLATKIDGTIQALIEAKAVGQDLKDAYLKQAVDYAANQGVDWVILTNGILWRIYKVTFAKPIDQELVCEINFLSLQPRDPDSLEVLYILTKEAWGKSIIGEYYSQRQALSRFCLAATVLSEPVLNAIRRELRKMSPDVKIDVEQIEHGLEHEVLKREVVEGDKADEARRKVARAINRSRAKSAKEEPAQPEQPAAATTGPLHVVQPPVAATLPAVSPAAVTTPPPQS
jgi:hypothetical protein